MTVQNSAPNSKQLIILTNTSPLNSGLSYLNDNMKQLILTLLLATAMVTGYAQDDKPRQCKGITTKNVQCKNRAKQGAEYCYLHNPDAYRCGAPTSKGLPCKIQVKAKGEKCWRHAGN